MVFGSQPRLTALPAWWDWNVSAGMRLVSLATLWIFLVASPAFGPLVALVVVVRLGATLAQTFLNTALAGAVPPADRDRLDGMLFGSLCLFALPAGAARDGLLAAPWLWIGAALCIFSALQLRMAFRCVRSQRRFRQTVEARLFA